MRARGMLGDLVNPREVPTSVWLSSSQYDYTEDARISTSGDRMLPWPVGTIRPLEERRRIVVHDPRGPSCSARWPGQEPQGVGATCIRQKGGTGFGVRPLLPREVWGIQGGSSHEWKLLSPDEERPALQGAVRALPARTAAILISGLEQTRQECQDNTRAGVGHDPLEAAAREATQRWFLAWSKNPVQPSAALPQEEEKAGALKDEPPEHRHSSAETQYLATG